ncbi:cofilin-like [Xenia sp. Carnegie-2017]|uniref:cofilin-like n=1 Tax=Xenia sp. Carnegie-2017 TaxID=2897299 RepID=UPI001F04EC9F|nr:cofilin-like [Xenia sp. Carnegie-2017]
MAQSGIEVDGSLKEIFNQMKLQKHPIKLLVMGFSDDEKTVVQREADSVHGDCPIEKLHEYFSHEARKTDCCYALYDYEGKLILIKWAPDNAKAKKKMMTASTFAELKKVFDSIKYIEATDMDDLRKESLIKGK